MDAKSFAKTCSRDAISWLPDEVLGKILSLLSTKQAASTSVLSKKWRYVFRLVDILDFDDSVSLRAGREDKEVFNESFKNFVDQTLSLQCDFPIKKFSLKCCFDMDNENQKACMDRWISNVVERGVLELELKKKDPLRWCLQCRCLPPQLFASKTLVKLSLGLRLRNLPSYVSLPSLKILFIDAIILKDNDLLDVLLAGCPVLEELSSVLIKGKISSVSLKRLSVRYNCWYGSNSNFSLDLPNLLYLDYSGFAIHEYSQVNLESLIEAKLNLSLLIYGRAHVTNLIMGIKNVMVLHLSSNSLDVVYSCSENGLMPLLFNNLVNLSFGKMDKRAWELLAMLLKHSPKLENLTIKDLNGYIDDISMPLNEVKVLHVVVYGGTIKEFKKLKSFLRESECLQLVQVDVKGKDDGIILQATKDLEMLPGVSISSKCHVKVTSMKQNV